MFFFKGYRFSNRMCGHTPVIFDKCFLIIRTPAFFSTLNVPETNEIDVQECESKKQYYLKYLMNNPDYSDLVFNSNIFSANNNSNSKTLQIMRDFYSKINTQKIGKEADVSEESNKLQDVFKLELGDLSYNEFLEVCDLYRSCFRKIRLKGWCSNILNDLDTECLKRLNLLTLDQNLRLLHVWTTPKLEYLNYTWKFRNKIKRKIGKLTKQQLVYYMYILGISTKRTEFVDESNFGFLKNIGNVIEELNVVELGIVSNGIYSISPRFCNKPLVNSMITKVLKEFENLNSFTLSSISKCFCRNSSQGAEIKEFQNKVIESNTKFTCESLFYAAQTEVLHNCINDTLIKLSIKKLKESSKDWNSVLLEKLTLSCAKCNLRDEEYLEMAIHFFESEENVCNKQDYESLAKFVSFLTYFNIYSKSLIEKLFSNSLYELLLSKSNFVTKYLVHTYYSLELEQPQYLDFISTKKEIIKFKKDFNNIWCDESNRTLSYHINNHLQEIYGEDKVLYTAVLPYFCKLCVMRFDKKFNATKIPEGFIKEKNNVKKPQDDDHVWICMLPITGGDFLNRSHVLNYIGQTKVRHFTIAGYKPIVIFTKGIGEFKLNGKELLKSRINEALDGQSQPTL